ncbi:MAG: helix-turn-helix transcriptional regulator [Flavobacteriales bacterium]|nr:helix-turn-helix transcriptional regulator [Flavobacteriales bacterium]
MAEGTIGQRKLTTVEAASDCPAEALLRSVSGKWKPRIILLATQGPLRFSQLLRALEGSNKQSTTDALRELEGDGLLDRVVIRQKPLHVEYTLTARGMQVVPLLKSMEHLG